MVTALTGVAEQVGASRIMKAGGRFHCPFGRPELPPETERAWRRRMVVAALKILTLAVDGPTVFEPEAVLGSQS